MYAIYCLRVFLFIVAPNWTKSNILYCFDLHDGDGPCTIVIAWQTFKFSMQLSLWRVNFSMFTPGLGAGSLVLNLRVIRSSRGTNSVHKEPKNVYFCGQKGSKLPVKSFPPCVHLFRGLPVNITWSSKKKSNYQRMVAEVGGFFSSLKKLHPSEREFRGLYRWWTDPEASMVKRKPQILSCCF